MGYDALFALFLLLSAIRLSQREAAQILRGGADSSLSFKMVISGLFLGDLLFCLCHSQTVQAQGSHNSHN